MAGASEASDIQSRDKYERARSIDPEQSHESAYETGISVGKVEGFARGYQQGFSDGFRFANSSTGQAIIGSGPEAGPTRVTDKREARLRGLPCIKCGCPSYSGELQCPRCGSPKEHEGKTQSAA